LRQRSEHPTQRGADVVDVELFARTGHVPGCRVDRPRVHAHDPASDDAQHGAAEPARLLGRKPRNDRRRVRGVERVPSRGVGRYLSPGYDIVVRVVSSCRKKEETRNASTLHSAAFQVWTTRCGCPADDRENGGLKHTRPAHSSESGHTATDMIMALICSDVSYGSGRTSSDPSSNPRVVVSNLPSSPRPHRTHSPDLAGPTAPTSSRFALNIHFTS
jgi:hypothetical protein